jgi:SAM-dependent methyltransferase
MAFGLAKGCPEECYTMIANAVYDAIGQGYAKQRRADPRIADRLWAALGAATSVLNVGAGAGSYEPMDRTVIAVEPSAVMLAQRRSTAAPAVQARAEALPFADRMFDAALAVLTVHHWADRPRGLAECARVVRDRVVLLTFDPTVEDFWLVRDYLPSLMALDRAQFPSMKAYQTAFGRAAQVVVTPLPIPRDCADGFLGAYWARPAAYLDAAVRSGISSFARVRADRGLERLRDDLASGEWHKRYGHLLNAEALDLGYRIVIARMSSHH